MESEMIGRVGLGQTGVAPMCRFTPGTLESESLVPVVLEFTQPPAAIFQQRNPDADVHAYRAELESMHRQFVEKLTSLGLRVEVGKSSVVESGEFGRRTVEVPHDFTHVFNGLGVLMPGRTVAQVAQMSDVRAITMNRESIYLQMDKSIPFTGAPRIWDRTPELGGSLRGEGIKVAVIDTGVVCR